MIPATATGLEVDDEDDVHPAIGYGYYWTSPLEHYEPWGFHDKEPETFVDPTYTTLQILREKSVLLRVGQARFQRGSHPIDMTEFDRLQETLPDGYKHSYTL